jgi:DNA repair protein RadA/Sms
MKLKTVYVCSSCQHQSSKWLGQCPSCQAWNSFLEDVVESKSSKPLSSSPRRMKAREASPLSKGKTKKIQKIKTGIEEFDRVAGDGIVPGGLTLLSGEPGIGKSTLTLQIAHNVAKHHKTLIVSGEESVEQIANRAERLGAHNSNLLAINEFHIENAIETIKAEQAEFVIIDSIQTISSFDLPSAAGSITQIRYCTELLMELAKTKRIPILIIGHVNKDGNLAGPKALEHLVDTVMHLEGDRHHQFRLLRAMKNRFGSCEEVGIFEMAQDGMREVKNPSAGFLEGRAENAIGSVITVSMEGTRPLLVEVQALVSTSPFGYPKRTANGFDLNRLQILIAVLEKYGKLNLQNQDVFINVVGGLKLNEPAADLAVLLAIASSLLKKPLSTDSAAFGEVGLSGELRQVSHHDRRQKEAKKLGFQNIISPQNKKEILQALRTLQN